MDKHMVDQAVEQFRALLEEQIARKEKMDKDGKDPIPHKDTWTIGLIDGDGIGPIIMKVAYSVLNELVKDEIQTGKIQLKRIEGLTLENRERTEEAVPKEVLAEIRQCDVLLKGPTTTPKGSAKTKALESANVCLRRELDLFANVRPVKIPSKGIDWTFFRENTEGEYVLGSSGVCPDPGMAVDFKVTTVPGSERIARAAFEYAKRNGKNKVAIVTKANILKKTDGLFSDICHEVAKDYPEIETEDWYVDIMAANLVDEKVRKSFQVFVLPNLYGDILTDEAAQIQGGVGTAGSANIGNRYAMFEAIHGTGLRMFEEKREQYASPVSILRALVMLLNHIGLTEKANRLETVLDKLDQAGKAFAVTGYPDGLTCEAFGQILIGKLKEKRRKNKE